MAARSRDLVMCSAVTPQSHHPRPNPIIGGSSAKDPLQIGTMPPFRVFVDDVSPVQRSLGTDHHRGGHKHFRNQEVVIGSDRSFLHFDAPL